MEPPLLLQLLVILATARSCGFILRRLGQPPVVGEMAAGLVLGPMVLGALLPHAHAALFPPDGLEGLRSLASVGLTLFAFVIGAELRLPAGSSALTRASSWIAVLAIAVPGAAGFAVAAALHPRLAPGGVGSWPFSAFVAAALAVTAFPVLARLLQDGGLMRSHIGQVSLRAAAAVDVCAWLALALLLGFVTPLQDQPDVLQAVVGLAALIVLLFGALKPVGARLLARRSVDESPNAVLGAVLLGVLACASLTEWLGIHQAIGALLFGASLPRDDRLLRVLSERMQHLVVVALLPIFFALGGLDTTPGAFLGENALAFGLILLAAVAGKVAGAAAGARIGGFAWRDSLAIGALMNARGVMELVVIRMGLDAGVIGNDMFTILMTVAIVTTAMTNPLVRLCTASKPAPLHAASDEPV